MPDGLRLDGYIRVSKVAGRSGDTFISPDDQRERIAAWARSRVVEIDQWHIDLDQSGGVLSRPGLDLLMERIRTGQTQGVAVAYVDRLSRAGVADALGLVEEIAEHGARFAALDLGIDPTTPFGEFGMTVLLALGRMQRRRIAEGWASATGRAVARGVHAHAPFGYIKVARGAALEPDPVAGPLVAELFRRRAAGESWAGLARWMDAQGVTPQRGDMWTRRSVETIIRNRAYMGEARYGEHVNPVAHEPLVGLDAWEAAQEARGTRPPRGEPALLSGLVRCAGCRYRMVASVVGQRRQLVYRCKRRHGGGVCESPASVERRLLDTLVEQEFLAHYGATRMEARVTDSGLVAARERLADAEAELIAYRDNQRAREVLERLGGGHFEEGLESRARAVLAAREALGRARADSTGIDLGSAVAIWPELTMEQRRRLLHAGLDTVFLRRASVVGRNVGLERGRVRIFWRGEAPHDLPGPGIRPEFRGIDW